LKISLRRKLKTHSFAQHFAADTLLRDVIAANSTHTLRLLDVGLKKGKTKINNE